MADLSSQFWTWQVIEVTRVVDGDTIDCVIDRGFGDRSHVRFRLAGIDTPEIYGRNASEEGHKARQFVEDWFGMDRPVVVVSYKADYATAGIGDGAFGRWLGSFYDAETLTGLSDALIGADLAKRSG